MLKCAPHRSRSRSFSETIRQIERHFGHENGVGAAGHARVQRNPSRIAPHHFDDDDAAMCFGGGVKPVDCIGRERDGGVESEAVRRTDDVVVDRLRYADERNPLLKELVRDAERAVAADADQRVEPHLLEHLDDTIRVVARAFGCLDGIGEGVAAIDGAEDCSAEAHDAAHVVRGQNA
ncbi:MAG: hypothetical protein QM736_09890 [Vicinamibacterales bacterium]